MKMSFFSNIFVTSEQKIDKRKKSCYTFPMNIQESFLYTTPIAHRGLHNSEIPENSIAAYRQAIEQGYAIEMDVRFSKDKKVVCFHDDNLKRMTGIDKNVYDCTYEELSAMHLKNTSESIPLFSDFLRFVDGKSAVLIELKPGNSGIVDATLAELVEYTGEYALQSFNPFYVKECKEKAPTVLRGQLSMHFTKKDFPDSHLGGLEAFLLRTLFFNFLSKPDFINYNIEDLPYSKAQHFQGKKNKLLIGWVTRTEEEYQRVSPHVDNVIFENIQPKNKK